MAHAVTPHHIIRPINYLGEKNLIVWNHVRNILALNSLLSLNAQLTIFQSHLTTFITSPLINL